MSELTLLGLGVVGSGVARACDRPDVAWSVRHALVRDTTRAREALLPPARLTTNPAVALAGQGRLSKSSAASNRRRI